jgi:hypothetical protein
MSLTEVDFASHSKLNAKIEIEEFKMKTIASKEFESKILNKSEIGARYIKMP